MATKKHINDGSLHDSMSDANISVVSGVLVIPERASLPAQPEGDGTTYSQLIWINASGQLAVGSGTAWVFVSF